jgi:hypothetical protein
MRTTAAVCRWIVGLLFVLAAGLKALSAMDFAVQVSYYGIVRTPWVVLTVAVAVIGFEAGLGGALLLWRGWWGWLLGVVAVVTVVFTGLILYAWIYRNLQDCGCFGKYLKMTPGWSVLKNAVVLGLIALAWWGEGARKAGAAVSSAGLSRSSGAENASAIPPSTRSSGIPCTHTCLLRPALIAAISFVMMAGAGLSAMLDDAGSGRIKRHATPPGQAVAASTTPAVSTPEAAATSQTLRAAALSPKPTATTGPRTAAPPPKPSTAGPQIGADKFSGYVFEWKGKRYDLTRGLYIVVMISDSCEGCAEIVRSLNALTGNKDLPPIVAFVLGEKETLERFRENYGPAFPTNLMTPLDFLDRIGEAPPRFILVRDGKQLRYWDTKRPPDEIALLEAVLTASEFLGLPGLEF